MARILPIIGLPRTTKGVSRIEMPFGDEKKLRRIKREKKFLERAKKRRLKREVQGEKRRPIDIEIEKKETKLKEKTASKFFGSLNKTRGR